MSGSRSIARSKARAGASGLLRSCSQSRRVPARGETDWTRVNAMTNEEVLAAAQADLDAQPLGAEALAKVRRVSRVKALRQRLGMTQAELAEAFSCPSVDAVLGGDSRQPWRHPTGNNDLDSPTEGMP